MRPQALLGWVATAFCAVAPASAAPRIAPPPTSSAELARLVCDEWGECWEERDRRYGTRPRYEYDDSDAYRGYQRPRQPTKWDRKGFCPPGQHKKGNC
jgi:hypothetical protein